MLILNPKQYALVIAEFPELARDVDESVNIPVEGSVDIPHE